MNRNPPLTVRGIEAVKPEAERQEVSDGGCKHLYLIVHPSGAKAWAWRGPIPRGGKSAKITLGAFPAHTLADARKWANKVTADRDNGIDPREVERQRIAAAAAAEKAALDAQRNTVAELFKRYMAAEGDDRKSADDKRARFEREVRPLWGDKQASSITRNDVIRLVNNKAKTLEVGTSADRLLALIGRMFQWALAHDPDSGLQFNPARGVAKPGKGKPGQRVLADDELRWFWRATESLSDAWRVHFRLLLLTGMRRSESLDLVDSEVCFTGDAHISLPGERTKNGLPHVVPLAQVMATSLNQLPRKNDEPRFFPKADNEAIKALRQKMQELATEERPGHVVPKWKGHDLRRTFATRLASRPISASDEVIKAALNHKKPGVTAIYNRAAYLPERREALFAWAALMEQIGRGKPELRLAG